MSKAIIFDLDGVLVDSKEIHFNALNLALSDYDPKYIITQSEQDQIYEGMTTRTKLDILTKRKGLPQEAHQQIWKSKQHYTATLFKSINVDAELSILFKLIKDRGIKIGVASNSIRETLDTCLDKLGIAHYVDLSLSNEDVNNPKPNPEIYSKCMALLVVEPKNTVIYEDSEIGQQAAVDSKAHVIHVYNRSSINHTLIAKGIAYLENN